MLVIDEGADNKLAKALHAFQLQPDNTRCIYFRFSDNAGSIKKTRGILERLIESAQQHIQSSNPKIYLCDDGDVFMVAPAILPKDARLLISDLTEEFHIDDHDFAKLYELNVHANTLLDILETKIEGRRRSEEEKQRQEDYEQQQNKRYTILNTGPLLKNGSNIAQARSERPLPHIMIIEDDTFSRRLVENVLKKDYSLTSLATADLAIATYINQAPDILFLDINLPDVTGHELLEKIMLIDPQCYVIMLSGNSDHANIAQAIKLGAKGFIAKPFNREKLIQYIDRCPTINK